MGKRRREPIVRKFGQMSLTPDSIKGLGDIKGDDERLSEVVKSGRPDVGKVGKEITSRPRLAKAILVIGKKSIRFQMVKKMGVKEEFKDFSYG